MTTVYVTLALIGGILTAIYFVRWLFMHSYDEFKLEQALMTQLYSRQENSKRKPFETYSYFDYLKSKWCCCGSPQHGKYVKAQKMLDEELDVLLIAKQLRLLRALANEKYTK